MDRLHALRDFGVSIWLDTLSRDLLETGAFADLIDRGVTGATVLAILRAGEQVLVPSGRARVHSGDVLAVAGSAESVAAARELLTGVGASTASAN